jgi:hypothetical protein
MKIQILGLLIFVSLHVLADSKEIKLTKEMCTPFNLGETNLKELTLSPQYYANCYASAAANLINTWLINKPHLLSHKKIQVSPHHLAITYALNVKANEFRLGIGSDWNVRKDGDETRRTKFLKLVKQTNRTEEETTKLKDLVQGRFYYFEENGGSAPTSVTTLNTHKVCPFSMVEDRFANKDKAQAFFKALRILISDIYTDYSSSDLTLLGNKLTKKMTALYQVHGIPTTAQVSAAKLYDLALSRDARGLDPLKFLDGVFDGLCGAEAFSLNELYTGIYKKNAPTTTNLITSTGPNFNSTLLQNYYSSVNASTLPLSVSYAAHAIWDGPKKLAWAWSEENNKWEAKPFGGHQSIVIGRRWNEEKSRCEFLIRNSFTSTSVSGWTYEKKNKFNLWIRDDYFFRSVNWAYHLKNLY